MDKVSEVDEVMSYIKVVSNRGSIGVIIDLPSLTRNFDLQDQQGLFNMIQGSTGKHCGLKVSNNLVNAIFEDIKNIVANCLKKGSISKREKFDDFNISFDNENESKTLFDELNQMANDVNSITIGRISADMRLAAEKGKFSLRVGKDELTEKALNHFKAQKIVIKESEKDIVFIWG